MEPFKRHISDLCRHVLNEAESWKPRKVLDPHKLPLYTYRCLRRSEIRFVILLQGQEHEHLNVEITHEDAKTARGYAALSYVWGEHTANRKPVVVAGRSVHWVTYNLWTALRHIRQKDMDLVLWVDAISIDQTSENEKGSQVQHMRWIYPRAEKVLCWLGEDDGTVSEAFEKLRLWANAYNDPMMCVELVANTEKYLALRRDGVSNALSSLFNRPYWRRAWCLQEICVDSNKPPLLLCGSHELSWTKLYLGFFCMACSLDNCPSLVGNNVRFILPMITTSWRQPQDLQMSDLVPDAAIRECSEPHDMIFSLLGLAERRGVQYPAPDYTRSIEETCVLYTREIMTTDQRLCVLSTVAPACRSDSVPSWCIKPGRWAKRGMWEMSWLDLRRCGSYRYCTTRKTKLCMKTPRGPLDPVLRVAGLDLDEIVEFLHPHSLLLRNSEKSGDWRNIVELCNTFCARYFPRGRYMATNESIVEAFLRTITCDDFWILACEFRQLHFQDRFYAAYRAHMRSLGEEVTCMEKDQLLKYLEERFCYRAKVARDEGEVVEDQNDTQIPHAFLERRACSELLRVIHDMLKERQFFVTKKGYIGLGSDACAVGDTVCLLPGSTVPFVLRQVSTEDESRYVLIGDAYVHGVMYGEAFDGRAEIDEAMEFEGSENWKVFNLI